MKPGHMKRFLRAIRPGQDSSTLQPLKSPAKPPKTPKQSGSELFDRFKRGGPLSLQIPKLPEQYDTKKAIIDLGELSITSKGVEIVNTASNLTKALDIKTVLTTKEAVILLDNVGYGSTSIVYKYLYVPTLTIIAIKVLHLQEFPVRKKLVETELKVNLL